MWPRTQEDDLAEQRAARALRLVLGGGLLLGGLALAGALAAGLLEARTWLSAAPVPVLVLAGGGLIRAGRAVHPVVDGRLPREAALPPTDPRRALPLARRRTLWILAMTLCFAGPVLAVAAAMAARDLLPGLARLGLFFGLSYGAVLGGRAILTRALASTRWPGQG